MSLTTDVATAFDDPIRKYIVYSINTLLVYSRLYDVFLNMFKPLIKSE